MYVENVDSVLCSGGVAYSAWIPKSRLSGITSDTMELPWFDLRAHVLRCGRFQLSILRAQPPQRQSLHFSPNSQQRVNKESTNKRRRHLSLTPDLHPLQPSSPYARTKARHSTLPHTPHKSAMASPTTPDHDRKGVRTASPSISSGRGGFSNVVDHLAPGVTENVPTMPKRVPHDNKIIIVQPLRRDEMQVRPALA